MSKLAKGKEEGRLEGKVDETERFHKLREVKMLTPKELQEKILQMPESFFLVDLRNLRESFYNLSKEELEKYPICKSGLCLNYIMDGMLKDAWNLIDSLENDDYRIFYMKTGLILVHPEVTWDQFLGIIKMLKEKNHVLGYIILTASRPFLLNGLNDFTRLYPIIEGKKDLIMDYASYLYGKDFVSSIYKLCLAEYKYQQSDLLLAEVTVSNTIREFDKRNEQRLLFVALYLMGKILLTQGRVVKAVNYIKGIRTFVKKNGISEFSYNIDAAETHFALYEGNFIQVKKWMTHNAPDEFSDFNMLDLYRYMVKMRCYIVLQNYPSVVALGEKIRPLLEAGKRHMDLCETDLLIAMSLWCAKEKDLAFEALDRALEIARKRQYYRLIADEGDVMLNLLIGYLKVRPSDPFIMKIVELTRDMSIAQPLYLKPICRNNESFSQMETDILKLLEHGKTKEEISDIFFISVNTVKYHMKNIYSKLNAKSPNQAVWNAKVLGVI